MLAATSLAAFSLAGDFSFSPGSWSSLTGTAANAPSLIETTSQSGHLSGSLSLKATAAGTQTLGGT